MVEKLSPQNIPWAKVVDKQQKRKGKTLDYSGLLGFYIYTTLVRTFLNVNRRRTYLLGAVWLHNYLNLSRISSILFFFH